MFFKTINNFSSYSNKQCSVFIILQGVSSSLEKADSEFPHVTDCTDGQVQHWVLEIRCHFQWDAEKYGKYSIVLINGNIFQRQ